KMSDLTESQKQTISSLASVSAGIAGGLAGDSASAAATGASAGKNAVENNSMSGLVPPRVQQDASLAFDPSQQGKSAEEVIDAIEASHMGPSWGTTYKVHPTAQAGGDVSIGPYGRTYSVSADDNHVSVNGGDVYGVGAHAGATIGLSFGPYFPGIIGTPKNDFSINAGAGATSWGLSGSKDGIGFSFGVGPSWGISATKIGGVDVNGNTTEELYHHDFK
ncbi:polymorphic toxin type 25 domain-containing protein, partial [Kluyvera genomosp. 2]|uniref:polymorphic toxin type 25 domain-containing protein n=1 Tax=Kluyvera genomosp. 2 TaxID=2774054 RepID=UPI002FD7DCEC